MVEAKGTYAPGMGREPRPDYGLVGVVCPTGGGGVITVKMVGPAAAVDAERQRFVEFCAKLTLGD